MSGRVEGLTRLRGSKPSAEALIKASIYIQNKQRPMAQLSGEIRRPGLGLGVSFNLELRGGIDPDFRLSFVHIDSTRDFDVFSFDGRLGLDRTRPK